MNNKLIAGGALVAFLGVALGAFGAHMLRDIVTPEMLKVFETGVRYHLVHALGIILIGVMPQQRNNRLLTLAGRFLMAGIVLFSGSLYILVFSGVRGFGAVTPFGGLAFLTGWLLLAVGIWRNSPGKKDA